MRRFVRRKLTTSLSMEATLYRGDNDEVEIEVEVTGEGIPFSAGNYENPPEGGVEDICATFWDGKKERDIPLTDDERATFEEELMDRWREDYEDRE
jgi:hypothetical protein